MSESVDKPIILVPGPMQVESGTTTDPERRQAIRYPFTAAIEVMELRSEARVIGRTSDLGRDGCYIDTLTPLAVGSVVRVRMERDLSVFKALATVIYAHLSMGMGLTFTEIKPEDQAVLGSWMAELSGERLPDLEVAATGPEAGLLSALLNLRQVLNELINMMVRKKIIHENEGAALQRRVFR
jgi:hypothetical protein